MPPNIMKEEVDEFARSLPGCKRKGTPSHPAWYVDDRLVAARRASAEPQDTGADAEAEAEAEAAAAAGESGELRLADLEPGSAEPGPEGGRP